MLHSNNLKWIYGNKCGRIFLDMEEKNLKNNDLVITLKSVSAQHSYNPTTFHLLLYCNAQ